MIERNNLKEKFHTTKCNENQLVMKVEKPTKELSIMKIDTSTQCEEVTK